MEFWATILLSATIAAIAAMGLFLQIRNGQMNVGMAVFSGIGGYVSGWLSTRGGLSPVLSIPVAVAGFNTAILISSSVTIVMAYASAHDKNKSGFQLWMAAVGGGTLILTGLWLRRACPWNSPIPSSISRCA